VEKIGEIFDRVMRKHVYGSIGVFVLLRLSLMMRLDISKRFRHKILVAARDAALKTVKILGNSVETDQRRSADIFNKIFPVSADELVEQKALGQMAHYAFVESTSRAMTLDEAINAVEILHSGAGRGAELDPSEGDRSGINITCTAMEDFLN
jgi:hypothetical protein